MSNPLERRISPRYMAVKNQATLEHRSESCSCRTNAELIDISREGALISAEATIPLGEVVRFRIENPAKTDWIAAISVRLDDPRLVGIRFLRPCPDNLLLAGMLGIELGVGVIDGDLSPTYDEMRIAD